MLIGYARVSTTDQNLKLQKDALIKVGCEKIYEDELSGTKDNRPGLSKAIEMLRENDTLVVWKLDRLGRSVKSLIELISELNSKNIHFKSLTDSIDTSTTRKQGKVGGRKRKMTDSKLKNAKKLLNAGAMPKDVAKDLGISIATLYRWIPAT